MLDYMALLKQRPHDQEASELVMMQQQAAGSYTVQVGSLNTLSEYSRAAAGRGQVHRAGRLVGYPVGILSCSNRPRAATPVQVGKRDYRTAIINVGKRNNYWPCQISQISSLER